MLARPSDQVEWQCRSPRMASSATSAGGSPAERRFAQLRRAPGTPSRRTPPLRTSRRAAARAPPRTRRGRSPAPARCPNRAGAAATSSTGTPSTVTPSARSSMRSSTATIWGASPKRACASGSADTTHSRSHRSRRRRTSPADVPADGGGDALQQLGRTVEQQPLAGRAAPSRPSASSKRASVLGPIPGTSRSRPAAAASRNCSAVRTPSARASCTARWAVSPR